MRDGVERVWHYLVLERFGEDLFSLMSKIPSEIKMGKSTILNIGIQLIDTIKIVHEAGYVHGDLKNDNLVIGRPGGDRKRGNLRLIDFGTAKKFNNVDGKHVGK